MRLESGSLAIISKRVGLDRVLSEGGGGDIGLSRPAVRAELKLVKEEGKDSVFEVGESMLGAEVEWGGEMILGWLVGAEEEMVVSR